MQQFLLKPDFVSLSEQWRLTENNTSMLRDVYDGSEFQMIDGQPFLSEPLTFGLMINVDWFLPYKHVKSYHVGAIYMAFFESP